jgi:hypothetical protein
MVANGVHHLHACSHVVFRAKGVQVPSASGILNKPEDERTLDSYIHADRSALDLMVEELTVALEYFKRKTPMQLLPPDVQTAVQKMGISFQ